MSVLACWLSRQLAPPSGPHPPPLQIRQINFPRFCPLTPLLLLLLLLVPPAVLLLLAVPPSYCPCGAATPDESCL